LRPSSLVMSDTPVEVQFTSAGCLNYPCRTPSSATQGDFRTRCINTAGPRAEKLVSCTTAAARQSLSVRTRQTLLTSGTLSYRRVSPCHCLLWQCDVRLCAGNLSNAFLQGCALVVAPVSAHVKIPRIGRTPTDDRTSRSADRRGARGAG
jgi:hypothetical protein